jgi:hypothetical protein
MLAQHWARTSMAQPDTAEIRVGVRVDNPWYRCCGGFSESRHGLVTLEELPAPLMLEDVVRVPVGALPAAQTRAGSRYSSGIGIQ